MLSEQAQLNHLVPSSLTVGTGETEGHMDVSFMLYSKVGHEDLSDGSLSKAHSSRI